MNYATRRLQVAATTISDELNQWGDDTLERMNIAEALEELNNALDYFNAHGATQKAEA